jgi:hypothetical protein
MRTAIIAAIVVLLFTAVSAVAVKLYVLDEQPGSRAYSQRAAAWSRQAGYPGGYGSQGGYGCPGSAAQGGCSTSGSGAGGCCGGGTGAGTVDLDAVKELAVKYYANRYKDGDVTAEVKDYGCHMEAYILKGGSVVKKLAVSGGNIYEI